MSTKILAIALSVLLAAVIAVLALAIPLSEGFRESSAPLALGSLGAASLAGLVAMTVNETFDERKRKELDTAAWQREESVRLQRERQYSTFFAYLVRIFQQGNTPGTEARVRAGLSVWASKELLAFFEEWLEIIRPIKDRGGEILPVERSQLQLHVGTLAVQVREDLGVSGEASPSAEDVAAALFDDFERQAK